MSSIFRTWLAALAVLTATTAATKQPNVLMIMTDDQDYRLGSLEYMKIVQEELVAKGSLFEKHFVTTAQCCPSRAALWRGQASHNTNNTHVLSPGGGWTKFLLAGEGDNYMPMWMKDAGYRTEYMGKLLNGIDILNYAEAPKGWDNVDILVDPYAYSFNTVIMSRNGETPKYYNGYHQSDVLRAKMLSTLEELTGGYEQPWFYVVAPTSPHSQGTNPPVPLARHANDFSEVTAPRLPNFNPENQQKPSWVGRLPVMNSTLANDADTLHRARAQSLLSIDEMVHDALELLESKGELDNTYVIFTADNGYHIGNHRVLSGKGLPYAEDTNVPFVVRGPGIPAGRVSQTASTHIDLAPTFLEIAGTPLSAQPEFLDGYSLLSEWKGTKNSTSADAPVDREILNIEFWGPNAIETLVPTVFQFDSTFKTLRIVGEEHAYLYSRWCTGETEFYNTLDDPYELTNLALSPSEEDQKVMDRLNALLLVTKSCEQDACRNPWPVLMGNSTLPKVNSLKAAMNPLYDSFFAGFPLVSFKECGQVFPNGTYQMGLIQMAENEAPFYPPGAENGLGRSYRKSTDNYYPMPEGKCSYASINETGHYGSWAQRNVTMAQIERSARPLTSAELPDPETCFHFPEHTA